MTQQGDNDVLLIIKYSFFIFLLITHPLNPNIRVTSSLFYISAISYCIVRAKKLYLIVSI